HLPFRSTAHPPCHGRVHSYSEEDLAAWVRGTLSIFGYPIPEAQGSHRAAAAQSTRDSRSERIAHQPPLGSRARLALDGNILPNARASICRVPDHRKSKNSRSCPAPIL